MLSLPSLVVRFLQHSSVSEYFNDLVNVSKAVVDSGKEVISNPKQTLDNALDDAKQLKEEATTEWNYRKLKNQQGLPFDISYKDAQTPISFRPPKNFVKLTKPH